jgi:hypothetical protein
MRQVGMKEKREMESSLLAVLVKESRGGEEESAAGK